MTTTPRLRLARTPAALLCACTILAACQDAVVTTPAEQPPAVARPGDPLAQRIVEMGFRPDAIVDAGDHFVVEGDIFFRKAELMGAPRLGVDPAGGPAFHYRVNNIVSQSVMAQGLKVSLSGITSHAGWTQAARDAIARWNSTWGTKIQFVEVSSGADITFTFNSGLSSSTIAGAQYPINGYPGWSVQINPYHNGLSATRKLNAMVHELGHSIGFRHTNYASADPSSETATYGAVHIAGTPTGSESASVMYSVNHNWNGFTSNDQLANRTLYPSEAPVVTSQGFDASNHPTFQWTPTPYAVAYDIRYHYYVYEFVYEPTFPEGGYWSWNEYYTDMGRVTGTSYTEPWATNTGNDECSPSYTINPVYVTGKAGSYGQTGTFTTC